MKTKSEETEEQDIALFVLFQSLWKGRMFIIKGMIGFFLLGLVIALTTPKEWRSNSKLIIKSSSAQSGGLKRLSSLASLAGINLGGGENSILNPLAYDQILKNDSISHMILNEKFYFKNLKDSLSLRDYLGDELKSAPVKRVLKSPLALVRYLRPSNKNQEPSDAKIVGEDYFVITEKESVLIEKVKSRLGINVDFETSIITISYEIQDPYAASQIVHFYSSYLIGYIREFGDKQTRQNLIFLEGQIESKNNEFLKSERELTNFLDSNQELISQSARREEERLRAQYNLDLGLLASLKQSYEEALINSKKKEEAIEQMGPIPIREIPAGPSKMSILISYTILGFFLFAVVQVVRANFLVKSSK